MNDIKKEIIDKLKSQAKGLHKIADMLKNNGFEKAGDSFDTEADGVELAIQTIEKMK